MLILKYNQYNNFKVISELIEINMTNDEDGILSELLFGKLTKYDIKEFKRILKSYPDKRNTNVKVISDYCKENGGIIHHTIKYGNYNPRLQCYMNVKAFMKENKNRITASSKDNTLHGNSIPKLYYSPTLKFSFNERLSWKEV
jgi:hypothetical protein